MKISEIINENFSGAFASVAMPMTPGTKEKDAKRSVYGGEYTEYKPKKKKKSPMIKR